MKTTRTIWAGFLEKGDRFLHDGVEHLVTGTDREPIRNARIVRTDKREFYIRRDSDLVVEIVAKAGAS